ncbi:MAG: adenosylhomocysteinase [Caldiserica bacterium]|nr:adenosylhomocysteinase [Caldisericota bacterium]
MNYFVKDLSLSEEGKRKIEWAGRRMPVLTLIKERFEKEKPLQGLRIGCCLHVTSETANLVITLKEGGADCYLCASNPLSTQDDVSASLVNDYSIPVFAVKGESKEEYYKGIEEILNAKPQITMDDGADLISTLHSSRKELLPQIIGGTEETTTGVIRLKSLSRQGKLFYPVIAVNDAYTKHLFDNRYGTGQSTIDGILRATNVLLAGKKVVVCGYGWCGRGVAMRAKGMGAIVIVVESNPLRALEAAMDGFWVTNLEEASPIGDIFITLTGDIHVLRDIHFKRMKDGVMLANSGHFNVEIDIEALEKMSVSRRKVREMVEEFLLPEGKKIYLLGEGRLINLSAAEGHPPEVMDMSFANQALSAEYLWKNRGLKVGVHPVPQEIDEKVAELKLASLGLKREVLTSEQEEYLASWELGT